MILMLLCLFPTYDIALAVKAPSVSSITASIEAETEKAKAKVEEMEAKLKSEAKAVQSDIEKTIESVRPGPIPLDEPSAAEWVQFVSALGGVKGMGTLGLVALAVQGLLLAARSRFSRLNGKAKLLTVSGLTMAGGVTGLMLTGSDMTSAIVHSTTLAAAQVYAHQFKREFCDGVAKPNNDTGVVA